MIVCVCANVSEQEIRDLLPASVEEVMMKTNCAMNCGICFQAMVEIVEQVTATGDGGLSSIRPPIVDSLLP